MSREILTPFSHSAAVELSGSGRPRFRKQIMKLETIKYTDPVIGERTIRFDQPYLRQLVDSFDSGAYDQVPFQIADVQNTHNNDPERTRGDLIGVELTADGIDGIFETSPEGAKLIENNPRLGVSCRIIENLQHANGDRYPRAIQHVLGTVNPRLRGMRPWQKVELSADDSVDQTTDLSGYEEEKRMPEDDDKGGSGTRVLELSDDQHKRLTELLEDLDAAGTLAKLLEQDDDPDDDPEQQGDLTGEPTNDPEQETVEPGQEQLAVLMARQDANDQRIIELTQQLRTANVRAELDELARQGLAPAIIRAAQPLLGVPTGAVELSQPDGSRVDPAEVCRDVLRTVLELSQSGQVVVDLDAETGWAGPEPDSDKTRRDAMVDAWEKDYGLK